jgi:hypothetical protein
VSPVKYELGFYIPKDDILHSHYRETPKSYVIEYLFVACLFYPEEGGDMFLRNVC